MLHLYEIGATPHNWMRQDYYKDHRFGYLAGLDGDQIEYANQASQGLTITFSDQGRKIRAKLSSWENYHLEEEKLSITLEPARHYDLQQLQSGRVEVMFELKENYFKNLCTSVNRLPPEIIAKIIPDRDSFVQHQEMSPGLCIEHYRKECSQDVQQFSAFKAIVSCPSSGPPVAILGAFGTGKTRVLALAAKYFIDEGNGVQVLVCTQQRRSAAIFLESFLDLHPSNEGVDICLIQNYGAVDKALETWKCTSDIFETKKAHLYRRRGNSHDNDNLLVIATCVTAGKLNLPQGFFTHVFLDEGANMREPENVAPLCFACTDTKIVIVGDPNQVPYMKRTST